MPCCSSQLTHSLKGDDICLQHAQRTPLELADLLEGGRPPGLHEILYSCASARVPYNVALPTSYWQPQVAAAQAGRTSGTGRPAGRRPST